MDIEKLKALALAATPGPWTFEVEDYAPNYVRAGRNLIAQVIGDSAECDATAELIAAAHPAAVLELIAEVKRLSAALDARIEEGKDNT